MTGRGWPNACSYCCHSYLRKLYQGKGTYLRRRGVFGVISELSSGVKKRSANMVRFHDDDLMMHDAAWLEEFSSRYADKVGLPFTCFVHPNTVTEQKAGFLKAAGCHDVEIGIQSMGEKTREGVLNRRVSTEQLERSISILTQCGLNIITDNIIGIPRQGIDEIVDLIRFHNEHRVMKIYCFGFRYYPRTDIVDHSRRSLDLADAEVENIEEGINAKAFVSGGDNLSRRTRQLQSFFAFLLYLPKPANDFILKHRLYRLCPPMPYFVSIVFSNWLRITYKYNWSLHISLARYPRFVSRKLGLLFKRGFG
jgi:hypothetical protein